MINRIFSSALLVASLVVAGQAVAQDDALTLEMAERAMAVGLAESRANGWNMIIWITDAEGTPKMVHRMEGATLRNVNWAIAKTKAVTATGLTSGEYGRGVEAGDIEEVEGAVVYAGAVPIIVDGERIGVISVSGARASEDEVIALAALEAITD